MMKRCLLLALIPMCCLQLLHGQSTEPIGNAAHLPSNAHLLETTPFMVGVIDHLQSQSLGEDRILNIYLPQAYGDSANQRFPVLYLLDGSAHEDFLHIVGLVQFLNMIQVMPPTIVVGIANVDRKRDFTFPTTIAKDLKQFPTTGGSEKFIAFIELELQPYIVQHYRVSAQRTLIGQSLGALLATEILLKKPGLFDRYIIVSPSLWWDDESLLRAAPALLRTPKQTPIRAYVAVGNEGKVMEKDAADLATTLKAAKDKNLTVDFVTFPEENHATILHRAVYKGFEVLEKK